MFSRLCGPRCSPLADLRSLVCAGRVTVLFRASMACADLFLVMVAGRWAQLVTCDLIYMITYVSLFQTETPFPPPPPPFLLLLLSSVSLTTACPVIGMSLACRVYGHGKENIGTNNSIIPKRICGMIGLHFGRRGDGRQSGTHN